MARDGCDIGGWRGFRTDADGASGEEDDSAGANSGGTYRYKACYFSWYFACGFQYDYAEAREHG